MSVMRKYICPNCGFRYTWQTKKNGIKRPCKNCGAQVYSSRVVLQSMMMLYIISEKRMSNGQ